MPMCLSNDVINRRFRFPYIAHVNKLLYYVLKLVQCDGIEKNVLT